MLSTLRIKNLAIVEDLEIEFGSGLNVVTGETGAGKSIVLKSLEILMGRKATGEILRAGSERCEVEGLFVLNDGARALIAEASPEAAELLGDDDEAIVRRTIDKAGRGKITLNGSLVTRGVLENLQPIFLDITGQHQQQILLQPDYHRRLLDQFGVPVELLAEVRERFAQYSRLKTELDAAQKDSATRAEYFRRLSFECEELAAAKLVPGEREALEQEIRVLGSLEALAGLVSVSLQGLEGGDRDDDLGVLRALCAVEARVSEARKLDSRLEELEQLVQTARVQLDEARALCEQHLHKLQPDPERLEEMRARIAELARLERKYSKNISELVEYWTQVQSEVDQYQSGELGEARLRERVSEAESALKESEAKLTAERQKVAKRLVKLIERELATLNLKKARFFVEILAKISGPNGADEVQFLLAANPGEAARSLEKVASGGELSRVLLILKSLLNEQNSPMLQVFDEIDAGVGGAIAQIVGEKLKDIARACQVLVVTHAPQIAALADKHLVMSKDTHGGRTTAQVKILDADERVKEVARMLAGKKVSSQFENSARELLGFESI